MNKIYKLAEESRVWKGSRAGYHAMHSWVRSKHGKPIKCEQCNEPGKLEGKTRSRWNIEYALKKSKEASRNIEDYMCLCKSCHRKMDMTEQIKKNISDSNKGKRLGIPNMWKRKEFCINGHKMEYPNPCKECRRNRSREFYRKNYAKSKQPNS